MTVEACSSYHGQLVADVCLHPVVAAIHLAFSDHRPLVLSPDILWLLIAQGFANHVNASSVAMDLGVSKSTLEREWRYIRAWLYKELDDSQGQGFEGL